MSDKAAWSDRLVRELATRKCEKPVDFEDGFEPIDCGEVYVCGGMCLVCSAKRYVERYPEKEPAR